MGQVIRISSRKKGSRSSMLMAAKRHPCRVSSRFSTTDLKPDPRNPRKHGRRFRQSLGASKRSASMRQF